MTKLLFFILFISLFLCLELISINMLHGNIRLKLALLVVIITAIISSVCLLTIKGFIKNYVIEDLCGKSNTLSNEVVDRLGDNSFDYDADDALEYSSFNIYKYRLDEIRKISGANSLYILKETNNKIVYIVSSFDSYKDFYGLGNEIDDEIREAAETALSGNEYISDKTVEIDDREVILCFYPVYDSNNSLIGAVGMEFDANIISEFEEKIKSTVLLLVPFVIAVILFSFIFLKKSINDITEEVVYTDNLTKLKNRLAYEKTLDEINAQVKKNLSGDPKIGIIIYDLNDLKIVNDSLGHLAGDKYIKNSTKIIKSCFDQFGITYRIGGDEFVTVVENNSPEKITQALESFEKAQEKYNIDNNSRPFIISIAVGYDYFIPGTDLNLASVIKRADEKMYKVKKDKKSIYSRRPR